MKFDTSAENVSVSMPSWLIEELDNFCNQNDYTRSNFVCRAVRKYLLAKMDSPGLWKEVYQARHAKS